MTDLLNTVRGLLDYDPETGVFLWTARRRGRQAIGDRADRLRSDGYRTVKIMGRQFKAHRLAWFYVKGEWPTRDLDHRNSDRGDNRIENLREATDQQNAFNRAGRCGKPKGVALIRSTGRWRAWITVGGKREHLGVFPTKEDARAAYDRRARALHGCFYRGQHD